MLEDRGSGSTPRVDRPQSLQSRRWYVLGALAGSGLIVVWVGLFVASVRQDRMALGRSTWIPSLHIMGVDFKLAIDHVARVQAMGFKPSQFPLDKQCRQYPYPPMIARSFRWVTAFDKRTASVLWQGTLGLIAGIGGLASWRSRRKLGLGAIPPTLVVAAVLFSTPFLFAVERGQCDPMIVPPLLFAAWLLGLRGGWAEVGAGVVLGLTAWFKYYPGLAVVALLALGRGKALASFVGVIAVVGVVDLDMIRDSIGAGRLIEGMVVNPFGRLHVTSHSLLEAWKVNGLVRDSPLARIPAAIPAALLLVPALVLVGRGVARAQDPRGLTFPFLLWLASAGTFALPYSNDYNLATLPLAMLAVWDRRERLIVHLAMLGSLAWLQPVALPIDGEILLFLKLGALYGTGACLVARADVDSTSSDAESRSGWLRPAFARRRLEGSRPLRRSGS